MEIIEEQKEDIGNNESVVIRGVYKMPIGYFWLTPTKSGNCMRKDTALKAAGFKK